MATTTIDPTFVPVDRHRLREAIATVALRVADLVRPLPDTALDVPGSDWMVGEHAAHLFQAQQLFARVVDGAAWDDCGNEEALEQFAERGGGRLAEGIATLTDAFLDATQRNEGVRRVHKWFGPMTMPQWESYVLVHLQMHGVPLARALGLACPVEADHMRLSLPFLGIATPWAGRPGEAGRLEIRLEGSPLFSFWFDEEGAVLEPPGCGPVDCTLWSDPFTFFQVCFGAMGMEEALQTGKLWVSGRKYRLGTSFKERLPNP